MKLTKDRAWFLKQFGEGGWSLGRPNLKGVKKWDAHRAYLIKVGLLAADEYGMNRITDAGLAALASMENGK